MVRNWYFRRGRVFGEKIEIPILLEKVFITDSVTTFTYNVNQKPVKAGIDPMNKFIDRVIDDNIIRVEFWLITILILSF